MRKKENIERIYQTALGVFADFGYRKSTLEDIAQKLAMTKGNLYLYAKNKKDLYRNSVAWALTKWQTKVADAVLQETDVICQFEKLCFKAVEYLSEDDDLRRVLVHDPEIFPMFPAHDPYAQINQISIDMIKTILEKGIREGRFRKIDTDKVSEVIFSIYKMFIIRTYIRSGGESMFAVFTETFNLLTQGLYV